MAYNNIFYTIKDLNDLSSALRQFLREVESERRNMLSETNNVGFYWNDDQYRKFESYMESLSVQIEQCSKSLERSNDKLEEFIHELLKDV